MLSDCRSVLAEAFKLALQPEQDVQSYTRLLRVALRCTLYCESYFQLIGLEHRSIHCKRLLLRHGTSCLKPAAERPGNLRTHLGGVEEASVL